VTQRSASSASVAGSSGIEVGETPCQRASQRPSTPKTWKNIRLSEGSLNWLPISCAAFASPSLVVVSTSVRLAHQ
jgi:hypothetical protein